MGTQRCDLFINRKVVVEVKNSRELTLDNRGQLRGYMQGLSVSHGLLLNFPRPNRGQAPQAEHHENWTDPLIRQILPSARS